MPTLSARATLSASSGAYSPSSPSVASIEAHGGQRLVGILAGGDGLGVADGDLAVQIRNVGDGLDLGVGALSANDHKVVDEHILTGVGVDEPGGLGVVHGALGSGDEHVDRGAGTHLLDEVAGGLKLRVGKTWCRSARCRALEPRAGPSRASWRQRPAARQPSS